MIDMEAVVSEASAKAGVELVADGQSGSGYYRTVLARDAQERRYAVVTITSCDGAAWSTDIVGIVREKNPHARRGFTWGINGEAGRNAVQLLS